MKKKHMMGFSLIELMIVVVVIGILAAIALPTYKQHLVKSRRSGAMAALEQAANAMDRYRLQNNTYVGASIATITVDMYTLSIQSSLLNSYTLRATPVAGSAQAGDGYIELYSSGARRWDEDDDGYTVGLDDNWIQG